jgi:anti-sigma B factor antagonist
MGMQLQETMMGDVATLQLEGKFLGGAECTAIYTKVKDLVAQGVRKVVIDLDGVSLMNSTGLGALVGASISLRNAGGDVKLSRLKGRMKGLLLASSIISIFESFDSIEAAVASFK